MGAELLDTEVLQQRQQLGERIRQLREGRGWSQDTLAHLAGLNRAYPHKIESGKVDLRYSTLARVARALEMTVAELVSLSETPGQSAREAKTP